jgi:carboxylesterase
MRGCLLIHGLTSTPAAMLPLKEFLISKDFKVSTPLLPGHGGTAEEASKFSWQDWYATVHQAFEELRRDADKVYFAGISLGALLGLKLAIDEGWGIRALALLSLPLKLPFGTRLPLAIVRHTPLKWIMKAVPHHFDDSVAKPEGRKSYKTLASPRISLDAVNQVMLLQKEVRAGLPKISNPILMLFGMRDITAPPYNAKLLQKKISSDVVETEFYARSRHLLTLDWDADAVADRTASFFERFS